MPPFCQISSLRRPCCIGDMMPRVLTALSNITVQPHRVRVKQEQDCVQHCAQSAEGEAAATSHFLLPTPHPSDPVIPSALPASSLHINLPSSFDSSPASLCSLSFIRVPSAEREQSKEHLSWIMWGKQVRSHLILLSSWSVPSFLHGKGNIIALCSLVLYMFLNRLFWIIAAIKCYAQLCAAGFSSSKPLTSYMRIICFESYFVCRTLWDTYRNTVLLCQLSCTAKSLGCCFSPCLWPCSDCFRPFGHLRFTLIIALFRNNSLHGL